MPLRAVLRRDLADARSAGDTEMVSLLRTLIAAIDNAEAVDPDGSDGATEVPRRRLGASDVAGIIAAERDELRAAAEAFERRGNAEEGRRLRSLAERTDRYARIVHGEG